MDLITVDQTNFESLTSSDVPILIEFWAPWCGPCRKVGPILEEIADDYAGKLTVGKMNVDENRQVAMDFGIMGIPAMILFRNGEVVQRISGAQPKASIIEGLGL